MRSSTSHSHPGSSLDEEIVRRILTAGHPTAVVLFGSEARQDTHAGSDLDLLIIEHENALPRQRRSIAYRVALADFSASIARDIDILVYTQAEIDEWKTVPNAFVTTALREGRVLYENPGGPGQRLFCLPA